VKVFALVAVAGCWTSTPSSTTPDPVPAEQPAPADPELDDVRLPTRVFILLAGCWTSAVLVAGCWTSSPPVQEPPVTKPPPPDAAEVVIQPEVVDHVDLTGPPPIAAPAACPSGQGLSAAITNASPQDKSTIIDIDVGASQGLTRQWSIGGPAACAIMRLEQTRIVAVCKGTTPAQIMAAPTAVLCAPAPAAPPQNPACPSGTGIEGRIIGVAVQGAATIITIAGGTDRGVDTTWLVVRPVSRPACTIVRVADRTTVATCAMTPDQIKADLKVLLCRP
jgi:hypothetical protein